MPWCGVWGTAVSPFWWVLPLIGLVFMGIMFFVCLRGFGCGCMGGRRRSSGDFSGLQREVEKSPRTPEARNTVETRGCCCPAGAPGAAPTTAQKEAH